MKNKNSDLKDRVRRALDIQPDVFPRETLIEIRGRGAVTVKGGGAIRVYNDDVIKLAVKGGAVCVKGEGLSCASYCRGAVTVEGKISAVGFEEATE